MIISDILIRCARKYYLRELTNIRFFQKLIRENDWILSQYKQEIESSNVNFFFLKMGKTGWILVSQYIQEGMNHCKILSKQNGGCVTQTLGELIVNANALLNCITFFK